MACSCKNNNISNSNAGFNSFNAGAKLGGAKNQVPANSLLIKKELSVEELREEFRKRFNAGTQTIKH